MSNAQVRIRNAVEKNLNKYDTEQRRAVEGILDEWSSDNGEFIFPIVDGPPGTGKTDLGTTAAAQYLLENRRGQIAYLAYTHFAVEQAKNDLYSLGFPTDKAVELHYNIGLRDWTQGIYGCDPYLESASFNDQRRLRECDVLLCTLHSSKRVFKLHTRPKILVDEFSQVSPPLFFSVLEKVFAQHSNPEGYALLGDPIQLPVISTQSILRPNIGIFIMQRKPHEPHRLVLQHRMHEDICEGVNSLRSVYRAHRIESGADARERDLSKLGYSMDRATVPTDLMDMLDSSKPFTIVDTDQCGEEQRISGGSVMNSGEATLAIRLAQAFRESFKDQSGRSLEPCILSPYAAQVGEIRQKLPDELRGKCITIYRSQGREYPCVIISFVRNNSTGDIGFLGGSQYEMKEQTYVGCSRAKGKLILLLSFDTFLGHGHPEFEALVKTKNAHIIDRW